MDIFKTRWRLRARMASKVVSDPNNMSIFSKEQAEIRKQFILPACFNGFETS